MLSRAVFVLALVAGLWALPLAAAAQTATAPADSTPTGWARFATRVKYNFVAEGQYTTGNVERMLLSTKAFLQYADSTVDWNITPRFVYGEQTTRTPEGIRTRVVQEREPGLDVHFGLFSLRRLYAFGFGTVEQSNLRGVGIRWLAGAGGGWHIVRTATQHLTFSAAVLREETDFVSPLAPSYRIFRGSFRLRGRHVFLKDHLRFIHITNYLPGLAFDANRRLNTTLTLEAPISRLISFTTTWVYSYEGIVPAGVRREDTRLTLGIKIANF